jgi:hypothetical protein
MHKWSLDKTYLVMIFRKQPLIKIQNLLLEQQTVFVSTKAIVALG